MSAEVLNWRGVTRLDMAAERPLQDAIGAGLESAVVVGWRDGDLYFSSSIANAAETMFLLQRAIYALNRKMDELTE